MEANKHIVSAVKFDLSISSEKDFHHIEQNISSVFKDSIQHKMSLLFDKYTNYDELIRIEKLELKLDKLDLTQLESDLWERIKPLLEKELTRVSTIQTGKREAYQLSAEEAYLHFLLKGYLPWWSTWDDLKNLEITYVNLLNSEAITITNLKACLLKNLQAWNRFILQATDKLFDIFFRHGFQSELKNEFLELIDLISFQRRGIKDQAKLPRRYDIHSTRSIQLNLVFGQSAYDQFLSIVNYIPLEQNFKLLLIRILGENRSHISIQELLNDLIRIIKPPHQEIEHSLQYLAEKYKVKRVPFNPNTVQSKLISEIGETLTGDPASVPVTIKTDSLRQRQQLKASKTEGSLQTETNPIYIFNAGLVILHPYLQMFFEELSLTSNNKFTDKNTQVIALLLLHYMVTGGLKPTEDKLVLNKLICGMPLDEEVDRDISLDARLISEADQLVRAVIANWNKLGQTSVEAFRNSFLIRKAILITKNKNLKLFVEPTGLDILLDYLPWSISMVKLPWMKQMLFVDWN